MKNRMKVAASFLLSALFLLAIAAKPVFAAKPANELPYEGTVVFGYRVSDDPVAPSTLVDTYVNPVIIASRGTPTTIRYINNLTTNVINWRNWTDASLHSAFHQATEYLSHGPAYYSKGGVADNEVIYSYPNTQEAAPLWFHDHLLGGTRLNATFAGLAGAYAVIDLEMELPDGLLPVVLDTNGSNDLDGANEAVVPLVVQDRMFDTMANYSSRTLVSIRNILTGYLNSSATPSA